MKVLYIKGLMVMMFAGAVFSGCTSSTLNEASYVEADIQAGADMQALSEDAKLDEKVNLEAVEITKVSDGKEALLNEKCTRLETYAEYNIQVSDEQIVSDLLKDEYEGMELKEHTVAATDDSNSENGKYDAVDTMAVQLEAGNPLGILAETIDKTVVFKRERESGTWVKISESCDKWNINHKKLGGTVWKKETAEGVEYIRLSSTIEFFYTKSEIYFSKKRYSNY